MGKLKYGIIGVGNISVKHLNGYSSIGDDVEILAACDLVEEKMRAAAEKYTIPNLFIDYRDLLAMKEIDFVSICLPNYLHAPVTIDALNAGKHVHCEKPMAMSSVEAKAMQDAKVKNNKKLMIGLNNRFTPQSMYIKRYIDEGNLGDIYFAKCGWLRRTGLAPAGWFSDKSRSGGGPLIDLGVHFIDLVMYFMNYPKVNTVMARTYSKFIESHELRQLYSYPGVIMEPDLKYDVEDLATGFMDLSNDAAVSFEVSWASNIEKEKVFYELYGTKGGIKFEDDFNSKPVLKIFSRISGQIVDIEPKINSKLYDETEFKHFVNCIRNGMEPSISVLEQSIEMMKIIESIYQSAKTRKPIIQ